ncbi:MAG TPA: shikimate dehydrogenase [Haliangium sp.]|nr:shikimate dehydrogenase [Haliangium sp.]
MSLPGAGARVRASTRVGAVIGAPVAHSRSPDLHNAAFAATGLDAVFVAWHVAPGDLAAAVAGFRALGLLGVSVTVPHKRAVAALCDRLAPPADVIGAVNCLVFEPRGDRDRDRGGDVRGDIVGHNTDAGGFTDSLLREAGFDPRGCRAVLLGAGGAARAVHAGLRAGGAARIDVVARQPQAVDWTEATPWTPELLGSLAPACDLLVDCTSLALSAETETPLTAIAPLDRLPAHAVVASLVYHRRPALLEQASARGLRTMDGAGMLVYQGARAFALWTGLEPPVDAMKMALSAALQATP